MLNSSSARRLPSTKSSEGEGRSGMEACGGGENEPEGSNSKAKWRPLLWNLTLVSALYPTLGCFSDLIFVNGIFSFFLSFSRNRSLGVLEVARRTEVCRRNNTGLLGYAVKTKGKQTIQGKTFKLTFSNSRRWNRNTCMAWIIWNRDKHPVNSKTWNQDK